MVIAVPLLLLALIVYLCRHHRHKPSTALLGCLAGVLLAGTAIGAGLANGAADLITSGFSALGSLFTD
ncbi:hypothetical protein ACFPM7_22880 [Actinokineospora guangxiensis]|uniref:GntP family permease n=1 Tax=Actinokineospora guangxiensis TaxID=1490288 RepID=A0ABW0EWH0_9PSEU